MGGGWNTARETRATQLLKLLLPGGRENREPGMMVSMVTQGKIWAPGYPFNVKLTLNKCYWDSVPSEITVRLYYS